MKHLRRLVAASSILGLSITFAATETDAPIPNYVGSKTCAGCHETVMGAWEGSHHAWAWRAPSKTTVLGDFDNGVFEHRGVTTRFTRRDDAFFIKTEGPEGKTRVFKLRGVAGVAPLQQYLVATEEGRLQALDIAWDVDRGRWYHLYPDQHLPPGDGLHWTGPYKNWNARCAQCHATGFHKNYDPRTHAYASTQAEMGVGCEACHGPGEAHIAWAQSPEEDDPTGWPGLTDKGLTIDFTAGSSETEIQQCAGCHSRRETLDDGSPLPGTPFHDAYRLVLLREGLYHADGSIQDEVYVYGSFLQSKMYARGVRCTDCHESHAASLKAEGNAVCTQCHSPAGNPRFPTLRRANYDASSHHFHEAGSEGAQCKSCHMIERVYMGIDGRRDHSFRVPRPDLSAETGAPNACTDCHTDRDRSWAAAEIARRFSGNDQRGPHFSLSFAAARQDPTTVAKALQAIAEDDAQPGIIRASALALLRPVANATMAAHTTPLIGDSDPLVREAAIAVQRGAPPVDRVQRLIPALEDPTRSVRISAARELLDAPIARLPPQTTEAIKKAMDEWRASLLAKTDFPETQMAIGGMALVLRNLPAAEQAFREAVRLDPQAVQAWTMIVRILAVTGNLDGARAALDDALAVNPSNQRLLSMSKELQAMR